MRFLIKVLSWAKGRPIVLDDQVTFLYLSGVLIEKGFALLRGLLITRQLIFVGRGTIIRATGKLFAARGAEIGRYCEIDCLSAHGLSIGRGSKIGGQSVIKVSGTLSDLGQGIFIGQNVGIGDFAHIGGAARVSIGDNTISGSYLSIHPENHVFTDSDSPIRAQGVTRIGISIGKNCWIGAKVTFLDGSSVGKGCVVAAGSVVIQKFPDHVVIGGVPAKILRHLRTADY